MTGAIHNAEPVWVNGRPTQPKEIERGDEVACIAASGRLRRARVNRVTRGGGKGTVWLHGASGAQIRCLWDERVAILVEGKRRYRRAEAVQMGDFLCRLVDGQMTVDPVVAIRQVQESVPAIILEIPAVSLLSEEGYLCRPS